MSYFSVLSHAEDRNATKQNNLVFAYKLQESINRLVFYTNIITRSPPPPCMTNTISYVKNALLDNIRTNIILLRFIGIIHMLFPSSLSLAFSPYLPIIDLPSTERSAIHLACTLQLDLENKWLRSISQTSSCSWSQLHQSKNLSQKSNKHTVISYNVRFVRFVSFVRPVRFLI